MTSPRPCLLLLFVLLVHLFGLAAANETFPEPAELQPDVEFWLDVFTEYGSDEGVLHDNRSLAVVYERLSMPESLPRRQRQKQVDKRRKHLKAILNTLASGKRDNLSGEEARVLALWPAEVTNKQLKTAGKRIRYQQGLKQRFRAGLQRSGRWREYINAEFTALGVPIDIAALPHVESSYDPGARSHVGASGIWQFTRSTGRRFMRVDHVVDERNDPYAATRAAGKLMAHNFSVTGNWPMAITAYNHGLAGVRRAMRKYGDTAYVEILRNYKGRTFGFASRNFYVAFLAAKRVDQNVEQYFPGLVFQLPTDYDLVELSNFVSGSGLAAALGTTSSELSKHNPGLQASVWQGSKFLPKGYVLRIPSSILQQPLNSVVAGLPAEVVYTKQLPDLFHTVSRGDTLSQIAARYRTRVATLVSLNGLRSGNLIRSGQRLRLPAAGPAPKAQTVLAAVATTGPTNVATNIETIVVTDNVSADASAAVSSDEVAEIVQETESQEASKLAEVTPGAMVNNLKAARKEPVQENLLADPSDYSVAADKTIEVQPLETLGHFGDWLEIKTQRLRDLNNLAFRAPVAVGQRIKLDLNDVDAKLFEQRRIAYHRTQQDAFFQQHVISGATTHTIQSGESIWILALRKYDVPVWLFRQYNPGVNLHKVRPGTVVQMPLLSAVERG